ncbi:MAG: MoxR family ATPase [Deltaproteobacteria bacterium]|jgi:MoxR-like ATPase|nr:MoxR family ATPase [Deltaproteobacteria bacterium]MBW2531065.1 MoxR family ATPase [Deltaproteobacteria bacterium]
MCGLNEEQRDVVERARDALRAVIRGKDDVIELLLVAVLGAGHALIEDVPGVGKTTFAKALARVFDVDFGRVQFTPDLLPSDILGSEVLNPQDGTFSFSPGPVFTNILLADEINRASPRTQAALLEAMNEGQVTIESRTHELSQPFFVIATQNPVDFQGTYPLPEAQLDRFLVRMRVGYPPPEDELQMLADRQLADPLDDVEPVASGAQILELQAAVRRIEVRDRVARYMLSLVQATRDHGDLELGISPRGALALYRAAQARAALSGRSYVSPADVQSLAEPALAHRVLTTQRARFGGTQRPAIIRGIIESVSVPT